jgi:two-component system phosphate regulon sensor histidine kinase PhoR
MRRPPACCRCGSPCAWHPCWTGGLHVEPELLPVSLDERAIEIAVINLVDNALKYAAEGRHVAVRVRRSGRFAEISVTDRGAGIPQDDRKRVFERFVRGRTVPGQRVRGSGIGLALVKHIAEAHGGRAWVEPTEEGGARFLITLRAPKVETGATAAQSRAPA